MPKKRSFREELKIFLTEHEIGYVKTSFDVIGDIAILEIDEGLRNKEKQIGEVLLSMHKNINTVLRKQGEHKGKLRKQKMKFLAGEDKRLALHKENNTSFFVDVEKVYFSPRLSTERKRIMQQVGVDENVLVMFSGAGPYPFVLSRNTPAKKITGIELNPVGHKLALENKRLNKAKNVDLYLGDVREIIPRITRRPDIGLKSNWRKEHMGKKLHFNPKIMEIYIGKGDLENHRKEFENEISKLSKKRIDIVLHSPLIYKDLEINVASGVNEIIENTSECFSYLEGLCKKFGLLGFVGHPYSFLKKERNFAINKYTNTLKNIDVFFEKKKYNFLFLENLMWGPFSNPKSITRLAKKHSLNICVDIAHLFSACSDEGTFYESFKKFPGNAYYHIADAKYPGARKKLAYEEHSFPVGLGKVDFGFILPLIGRGIAEVINKDELKPIEMVESWKKLNDIADQTSKFDRILMPLPKTAEEFLPNAFNAAKKKAIIHLYDFLHEDDFYLIEEKAKKACRNAGLKYKKIGLVKCGRYSPRTYRVCLDFQVL